MAPPLGGVGGDPGALATFLEDVDGGSPRRRCQRSGSAHHLSVASMAGPLGGAGGDPEALTTLDIDGAPP
jgi:hypothetical protein